MRRETSIEPGYFEAMYCEKDDPWGFETSPYEAAKYDRTLAALPFDRVRHGLEVGCANGVLTARLGPRCEDLLAIDVSETALRKARARCREQPHIRFERRGVPQDMPGGRFDLVLLSEMVYYLDRADIGCLAAGLDRTVAAGGHLLLVHWLGETDYPMSGDDAVAALGNALGDAIREVRAERHEAYRLDLWQRR